MPVALKCVGRGVGGVEEMATFLDPKTVCFGLLRCDVGAASVGGVLSRQKYVAVHWNGEECPTVKRGRANAQKAEVMELLQRKGGTASAEVVFTSKDECTIDAVVDALHRTVVVDARNVDAMRADVKAQLADAKRALEALTLRKREKEERECRDFMAAYRGGDAAGTGGGGSDDARAYFPGVYPTDVGHALTGGREVTVAEACEILRAERGTMNWLLCDLTPETGRPRLFAADSNGLHKLTRYLAADAVFFGLIRMTFGIGKRRRRKFIFLRWIGEDVSATRRRDAEEALSKMRSVLGPTSCDHFATSREDVTADVLVDKLARIVGGDGDDEAFGKEAFVAAAAEETEASRKAAAAAAAAEKRGSDAFFWPPFEDALASVREDSEPFNWVMGEIDYGGKGAAAA